MRGGAKLKGSLVNSVLILVFEQRPLSDTRYQLHMNHMYTLADSEAIKPQIQTNTAASSRKSTFNLQLELDRQRGDMVILHF